MKIKNKEIQFVMSSGFNQKYGGIEATAYIIIALKVYEKYPVDMLIFEMKNKHELQVRLAGYDIITGNLDEKTIVFTTRSLHINTFWLKLDEDSKYFVGTFLFPSEY